MKKLFLCLMVALGFGAFAQETNDPMEALEQRTTNLEESVRILKKLKVSGYIQAQYQYAETDADGINFKLANRANAYEAKELESYGRFGIRRGRVKFTYEEGIASGVVQIDVTDKGISGDRNVVTFKDVYLNVKDPWIGTCSFKAGIFDRPFGHEIAYSSSSRESPERARIIQSLFPDERDLGAMLTLQPAKTSGWNILKLEAGMFTGSGIKPQFDSHMDFIGHLSVTKVIGSNLTIGGGVSLYAGGILQTDSSVYKMKDDKFVLDSKSADNIGKYAKRQYIGFDFQFGVTTAAGLTQLRAEYIFGEQPQNAAGSWDYKFMSLPTYETVVAKDADGNAIIDPKTGEPTKKTTSVPVYMRKVSGGYVILTQDLGTLPLTAIVKYDWYNPNTEISGNDVAVKGSGTVAKDLSMNNIGAGLMWRINQALRLTAYYDFVNNETTENLKDTKNADGKITKYGWEGNRKDNVFTLRLQYKF